MENDRNGEIKIKHSRISKLLDENKLDGLLLSKHSNFKWFSCGGLNDVIKNDDTSLVYLYITGDKRYFIATKSDSDRVMKEELEGLGFEAVLYNWHDQSYKDSLKRIGAKKTGADFISDNLIFLAAEISAIRALLTEPEIKRYGNMCSEYTAILTQYCNHLKPGISEKKVAAGLLAKCAAAGIRLQVLMVGSDERISLYRHPCATDKIIMKYVLIATVAEREGICANVSRSIYFGTVPDELMKKQDTVNQILAVYQNYSMPGTTLGKLFEIGKKAYDDAGYPGEWKNHLQGGISGYAPLEFLTLKDSNISINENNILGWNPTVKGAKSEDPCLVTPEGPVQFTIDKNWPSREYTVGKKKYRRPLIFEMPM